jgi:UDP-N-acetyl-D-mannosaminuronate dehydrogenase
VYHDPFVPKLKLESGDYRSVALDSEAVRLADVVLITTDHSVVDYDLVLEHAEIVVDPRNGLSGRSGRATVYPIAGPPRLAAPVEAVVG